MALRWVDSYDIFLFDFDGLLVRSEELHHAAYIEMCRRRGITLTWDFAKFCSIAHSPRSNGIRDDLYADFPALREQEPEWETLYAEKKACYQALIENGKLELMPGVEALLNRIAEVGARRCVATHSPLVQVAAIRRQHPVLNTIPLWITREDYDRAKPAPDCYLHALKKLNYQPGDRVIGFEDTYRGLEALLGAGAHAVLVSDPSHPQLKDGHTNSLTSVHFPTITAIGENGPFNQHPV
eukprot:GILJ01004294.1.p1 GENE.GILJ01004294.1~~GILJ01004294.1.p1  ORF type:complete len:254 (-),score=16.49 GILJ01004294.1:177-893(-)